MLAMPDLISCPHCGMSVSRHTVYCRSCGGEVYGVPDAITLELLAGLSDEDLPDVLFQFANSVLSERGCFELGRPDEREVLASLPRGVRVAYTLVNLDSEVGNGGFSQWFGNWSGRLAEETVEDLGLIGATRQAEVVRRAIQSDRFHRLRRCDGIGSAVSREKIRRSS